MEDEVKGQKPNVDELFTPLQQRYRPTDADRERLQAKIRSRIAAAEAATLGSSTSAPTPETGSNATRVVTSYRTLFLVGSGVLALVGAGVVFSFARWTDAPPAGGARAPSANVVGMSASAPGAPRPSEESSTRPPLGETSTTARGDGPESTTSTQPSALDAVAKANVDVERPNVRANTPAQAASRPSSAKSGNAQAMNAGGAAVPVDALERETNLLREANHARNDGRWPDALRLLDQHAREFPRGVLADERAVEHVVVLCRLGRDEEAKREAEAFLAARPKSLLRGRIESTCAGASARTRTPSIERSPEPSAPNPSPGTTDVAPEQAP
jgi:hypothetical protein